MILESDDLATHASKGAPPTHQMAVRLIMIVALTRKAGNLADRVLVTAI